jgi:hypothetical protein
MYFLPPPRACMRACVRVCVAVLSQKFTLRVGEVTGRSTVRGQLKNRRIEVKMSLSVLGNLPTVPPSVPWILVSGLAQKFVLRVVRRARIGNSTACAV